MRAAVLVLLLAITAGCGANGARAPSAPAVRGVDPDGTAPYIGSLSVNPADGSLLMATNTGLWKIGTDGGRPTKVTGHLNTPTGSGPILEALVVRFVAPPTSCSAPGIRAAAPRVCRPRWD